nr:MAG TPA: hypothetical protein [Bacteriophage sp.]
MGAGTHAHPYTWAHTHTPEHTWTHLYGSVSACPSISILVKNVKMSVIIRVKRI